MAFSKLQTGFVAGELSPALFARVDLAKYSEGAALLRNFLVDYRGGASTRPGTEYINRATYLDVGQPRFIPFTVSTLAAYICVFTGAQIRFIANAGMVLAPTTTITSITAANPAVVTDAAHGYSAGDMVHLAGVTNLPSNDYIVFAPTTNTYQLKDLSGNLQNFTGGGPFTGGTAARVVTVTSPYAAADLPLLKYTQSADVLTLTHPSYPPYNLTRTGASTFTLTLAVSGATTLPPSGLNVAQSNSHAVTAYYYGYVVTSVSADGREESLPTLPVFVTGDVLSDKPDVFNSLTWIDSPSKPAYYKIYKVGAMINRGGGTATPPSTLYGFIGQSLSTNFVDNYIIPDFSQTPPTAQDPFSPGQIADVVVATAGAGYGAVFIAPLVFTGGGGSGAAGYAVVNPSSNSIVGAVLTSPGKGYTTAPTVTDSVGSATYTANLGQLSGTYPACVTYDQQRRVYAATPNFPEAIVTSQTGLYSNFNTSAISQAADSITVSLASSQDNSIKSLVSMNTGLIAFTSGGAFLISGGGAGGALTPDSVTALPQASSGANDLPPLRVNYDVLYGQNRGSTIRDFAFNFYVQSYAGTDRSVLASHLFSGHTITEWTYAEEPFRIIHCVRDDGVMLNFTYVPEQELFAWTHYDTLGAFVSIASIPEGNENAVYVVVQRLIAGQFFYFYERIASRQFDTVEDSWCLDAALSLPRNFPNASISLGTATGDAVNLGAGTPVFNSGMVGWTLWAGGGKALVTGFTDSSNLTIQVLQPFPLIPNTIPPAPRTFTTGRWSLDAPVTTVTGLGHLNGAMVSAQADGVPVAPQLVSSGTLTLPEPATKVVAGLAYQCQLQTLKLDLGEPTVQGKRKLIPAVTLRVDKTVGLLTGPDFAHLTPVRQLLAPFTPPLPLFSGDLRQIIMGKWATEGQICIQQDDPLPATVLGLIPEVVVGDTMR